MKIKTMVPIACALTMSIAVAQTPPVGPAGPYAPPAPEQAQAAETVSGQVKQYLLAPRGELDGLLLTDGTQVGVTPHLSEQLAANIKPGDTVQIQGRHETATRVIAQQISNTQSGTRVVDQGPGDPGSRPPPPSPPDDSNRVTLSAQGKVSSLLSGPRGEVDGAVLDDSTVIRFAPHTGLYYASQLQVGNQIAVSGFGTQNQYGRVIEAQDIRKN